MNKPKIAKIDEYGVKEYNQFFLIVLLLAILYGIIALTAHPLLHIELSNADANIKTYTDAFWTLQMAASTIGFGDHYPVTFGGRNIIALMFYVGMGTAGAIATLIIGFFMRFSDTAVKNRELRHQNATIIEQNTASIHLDDINNNLNAKILAKLEGRSVESILEEANAELRVDDTTQQRYEQA